ncbi:MAG TPA: hypothetical protein VIH90_05970 [Candidatus Saccharimonadales bacterium]
MINNKNNTSQNQKSHKLRSFFAAIAGIVAVYLIMSSITVIWLNRTVTDTNTYVKTVSPLIQKPEIQNFIAAKVTDQIVNNAPIHDVATSLLPPAAVNNTQTVDQLKVLLTPVIQNSVLQIVKSPAFATLWTQTNRIAHAQLVSQLNNNNGELQLNLSPAVNAVIAQIKTTDLSPIADKITVNSNTGNLDIKSSGVKKAHHYYELFKTGTWAIVAITVIAIVLSIWLSVHHLKTIRRILIGVGVLALLQALILEAPVFINVSSTDKVTQDAAKAFAEALFHNLQLASLIVGVLCILAAIASKIYEKRKK